MHARAVSVPIDPVRIDDVVRVWGESVLPAARKQKGFEGALVLGDRSSVDGIAITLWASAADMATGERSGYYTDQLAKFAGMFKGSPVRTNYEVLLQE